MLRQQQPDKKTPQRSEVKNKNGLLFVLGEWANYKTSSLSVGLTKHHREPTELCTRFGVRRMWEVSFSVHKQAVSVHTPECAQRGRIVAATSTNKLLCDSLAPLTSSRHVLSAPFSGRHYLLFASVTKMEHLTIFKHA